MYIGGRLGSSPPPGNARWIQTLGCLLVVSSGWGLAQNDGTLRGSVVDENGTAVAQAVVAIRPLDGVGQRLDLETTWDGTYGTPDLAAGLYTVTAKERDRSSELYRVRVRPGRTVEINFQLARGRDASWLTELGNREAASRAFSNGVTASRAGNPAGAIEQFTHAIDRQPDCGGCFYNLAIAYVELERYVEAEDAFKRVLDLTPDYAAAYYGLATVYTRQQRTADAASARSEATRLALAGLAASRQRLQETLDQGISLFNAGDVAGARARFESLLKQDSGFAPTHYWLGMVRLDSHESDDAAIAFERYLQLDRGGEYAGGAQDALSTLGREP